MNHAIKLLSDLELIQIYRSNSDTNILSELLERHSNLLKKLSHKHCEKNPSCIFEDCYQNAIIGAITAYNRYNLQSDVKLITFLHTTVYYHLLSCDDTEAFVSCPTNLREVRSYFAGKFTGQKKLDFEKKYNLMSEKDILDFQKKHNLLAPSSIITTDILPEAEFSNENEIVENVQMKIFLDTLPEEEKNIVMLFCEGHSLSKIAQILSSGEKKITDKQIKKRLQSLQQFFV